MHGRKADGYKVLMYLRGEITAEKECSDREEAQRLLTSLTASDAPGVIIASDNGGEESERKIDYDKAEMWRDGELIAFGLRPLPDPEE